MAAPVPTPSSPSDVFAAAVTGDLKSNTKSNAPLDPNTIANLATGIVATQPKVETVTTAARATYFRVQYAVQGAAVANPVYVEIGHYTEAAAAQDVMRQYLTTFDTDVATVTKKPDKALGQVSLQTGACVFWVRDAVWVRLQAPPTEVPKLTRPPNPSQQSQAPTGSTTTTTTTPGGGGSGGGTLTRPGPPAPAPAAPNPVLDKLLLPLANAMDAHLAKFAVAPANQLKPKTAMQTSSYKGLRGKEFSFRLVDASGTHVIKPAEPVVGPTGGGGDDAARIVIPTANGSAEGVYTFLGRKPGKGRLRLVVARADTLAVGAAEVGIEIV